MKWFIFEGGNWDRILVSGVNLCGLLSFVYVILRNFVLVKIMVDLLYNLLNVLWMGIWNLNVMGWNKGWVCVRWLLKGCIFCLFVLGLFSCWKVWYECIVEVVLNIDGCCFEWCLSYVMI